jgi:mannitol/fructose-specific phosphotransferase system IIA component
MKSLLDELNGENGAALWQGATLSDNSEEDALARLGDISFEGATLSDAAPDAAPTQEPLSLQSKLEEFDDYNGMLEFLKDPQKLVAEGYDPNQIEQARKGLVQEVRGIMEYAPPAAWTGGLTNRPKTDEEWEAYVFSEPTFGEHAQELERAITSGTAQVFLGTLSGLASTIATGLETNFLPSSRLRDLSKWAADTQRVIQEGTPSDPRMNAASSVAYAALGQTPAQLATVVATPLNLISNYGQIMDQFRADYEQAEFSKAYTEALEAGSISEGTTEAQWLATLSEKDKEDLRYWANAKAMVAAVPAASLETVAEKLIVGKALGKLSKMVPGAKWAEKAIKEVVGLPSTQSFGQRVARRILSGAAVEAAQEPTESIIGEVGKGLTITGDFSEVANLRQRGLEALGGAVGGTAMAGPFAVGREFQRQKGFDWANKVLAGEEPSVVRAKETMATFADTPDSFQYRQAKANATLMEDQAHHLLDIFGDTARADTTRAERYRAYEKAQTGFKASLDKWLNDYGIDPTSLDQVREEVRVAKAATQMQMDAAEKLGGNEVKQAVSELAKAREQAALTKLAEAEAALFEASKEYTQSGEGGAIPLEMMRLRIAQRAVELESDTLSDINFRSPEQVSALYEGMFTPEGTPRVEGDPEALQDFSPEGVAAWLRGRDEALVSAINPAPEPPPQSENLPTEQTPPTTEAAAVTEGVTQTPTSTTEAPSAIEGVTQTPTPTTEQDTPPPGDPTATARVNELRQQLANDPAAQARIRALLIERGESQESIDRFFAELPKPTNAQRRQTPPVTQNPTVPRRNQQTPERSRTNPAPVSERGYLDVFRQGLEANLQARKPQETSPAEWDVIVEAQVNAAVKKAGRVISAIKNGDTAYTAKNPEAILNDLFSPELETRITPERSTGKETLMGALLKNFDETGSVVKRKTRNGSVVSWQILDRQGRGWANDWARREAERGDANLDDRPLETILEREEGSDPDALELPQGTTEQPAFRDNSFSDSRSRRRVVEDTRDTINVVLENLSVQFRPNQLVSDTQSPLVVTSATEKALRSVLEKALRAVVGPETAGALVGDQDPGTLALANSRPELVAAIEKMLQPRSAELLKAFNETFRASVPRELAESYAGNASPAVLAAENLAGLETFMLRTAAAGSIQQQLAENPSLETLLQLQLAESRGNEMNRLILSELIERTMREQNVPQASAQSWLARMSPEDLIALENDPGFPPTLREINRRLRETYGNDPVEFMRKQEFNQGVRLIGDLIGRPENTRISLNFNWAIPETLMQGASFRRPDGSYVLQVSPGLLAGRPGVEGGSLLAQTVLHETVHPLLDSKISAYLSGNVNQLTREDLEGLRILDALRLEARDAKLREIMEGAEVSRAEAVRILNSDRNFRGINDEGGLHEFIQEAINHKPLQDFLAGVTTEIQGRSSTIWQRVINLISRLLTGRNVALDSVLQRAMEEGLRLSSESEIFTDQAMQRAFLEANVLLDFNGRTFEEVSADPEQQEYLLGRMKEFRELRGGARGNDAVLLREFLGETAVAEPALVESLARAAREERLNEEAARLSVSIPFAKAQGQTLRNVLANAIPEIPSRGFFAPGQYNEALRVLGDEISDPAFRQLPARGKRTVNLNSPDEPTATKLGRRNPTERWDGVRAQLKARAIHALTEDDRVTPKPNKIISARLIPQTLRQADFVGERDMVIEDSGVRAVIPMWVYAKLYTDPSSPTGQRWHFVEVRKNGNLFETQYSDTNPERGRALAATVVGIGDNAPRKKKSDNQAGYAQANREAEGGQATSPPSPQGIEPLPESRTEAIDNTLSENVQEKIIEQAEALAEKRARLIAAGDYKAAGDVQNQIEQLEALFDGGVRLSAAAGTNIEVAPNPTDKVAVEKWNQLSNEQKFEATRGVGPAVLNKLAEDMGLPAPEIEIAVGGFWGKTNPTMIVSFPGELSFDQRKEFSIAAGVLLRQNSVVVFDEEDTTNGDQGFFVKVIPSRPLTFEERAEVFNAVSSAFPAAEGFTGMEDALVFGNFTQFKTDKSEQVTNEDFQKGIEQILPQVVEDKDYQLEAAGFNFRSELVTTEQTATNKPLENTRYGQSNLEKTPPRGTLLSERSGSFDSLQTFADQTLEGELNRIGGPIRLSPSTEGMEAPSRTPRQSLRPNAEPNPAVREGVRRYNERYKLAPPIEEHYAPVNETLARQIAAAYESLPVVDDSAETREAYAKLAEEIQQQWDFATQELGITFLEWNQEGQPYASSREMVRDVRENKRLYFFTGGEPHPFLNQPDENGLTMNDKLRAIHDLFGHAAEDYQFGPRGEENAWIKHSQMFSPLAQRALTTETRGQNSWVNFGPQNYNEDGSKRNIPPAERPFAVQKAALLPENLGDWRAALSLENPNISRSQDTRFSELTALITPDTDLEAWKAENPEAYAELKEMREKVLREAGYDVKAYHGTPNGTFTEFDVSNQGATGTAAKAFWFTEDKNMAKNFANLAPTKGEKPSPTVISVMLKPGDKPASSDFKGIPAARIGLAHSKRASVISRAKREGKSFVKFTNMFDFGGPATVYAVFNPNQIKSAEPLNRDENGNLIPPSQWANEGSNDIRLSASVATPKDARYLELAKDPEANREELQRMVDATAKRAGYTEKAYHGSPNKPFWVFDPLRKGERTGANSALLGFFATNKKEVAEQYRMTAREKANAGYTGPLGFNLENAERALELAEAIEVFAEFDPEQNGFVGKLKAYDEWGSPYEWEADPYDPYETGKKETVFEDEEDALEAAQAEKDAKIEEAQKQLDEVLAKYEKARQEKLKSSVVHDLYLKFENPLIYDYEGGSFKDKSYSELIQEAIAGGHDGVIMENTRDAMDDDTPSDVFVFFKSSQAKLADPVTYDEQGNVIPLSQRFNSDSNDIRFSRSAPPVLANSYEASLYEAITGEAVVEAFTKLTDDQRTLDKDAPILQYSASAKTSQDARYLELAKDPEANREELQRMVDEKLAAIGAFWHGTPSGDLRGGVTGLHVGTKQAAMEALEARIGIPADGRGWDGTREYGDTLLAGKELINTGKFGKYRLTGYNVDAPSENYYPKKMPTLGNGVLVNPKWKPWLRPVLIVGGMTNTRNSPISDNAANRKIKRKKGAFYINEGEDAGSVSAVLPNGESVRVKLPDPVTYDEQGNVIPLSQRFNSNSNDIRFSAPVQAQFPASTATLYNRAAAKNTTAFSRLRSLPEWEPVTKALDTVQYIPDTQAAINERATAYIEDYFKAHPTLASDDPLSYDTLFRAAMQEHSFTGGDRVVTLGHIVKRVKEASRRVQALANAADSSLSQSDRASAQMLADLYNETLSSMLAQLAELSSMAGSELNYVRMVSHLFDPITWRRQYTNPAIKGQAETLGAKPAVKEIMGELERAHDTGSRNTYERMLRVIEMASRRFLPKTASERGVRANSALSKALSDAKAGMTNVQIVEHATEVIVAQVFDNLLRKFEAVPNTAAKERALRSVEERARALAQRQINGVLEARLQGGRVEARAEAEGSAQSDMQKALALWAEVADEAAPDSIMEISKIIFDHVLMEGNDADTPYSGLFVNDRSLWNPDYIFDTEGAKKLRKAVLHNVILTEEVRRSLQSREMTEKSFANNLAIAAPHLSQEQRDKIAAAAVAVYRDEVSKAAEAGLARMVRDIAKRNDEKAIELRKVLAHRQTMDRLLGIINMGAFQKPDVYNALAPFYGLPTYNKETADEIERDAQALQALSDNSIQRGEAEQRLMLKIFKAHFDETKGFSKAFRWWKISGLVWQAGVLQGLRTQGVNAIASFAAVQMESAFSAAGHALYMQRQGVPGAQAYGAFGDIVGGLRRAFGKNLDGSSRRAFDETWSAVGKGMSRFKTDKLETLPELEAFTFEPAVAQAGENFMDALQTKGLPGIAGAGVQMLASYELSKFRNPTLALVHALQGKGSLAAKDLARLRDNYLAGRKLVARFMMASDAINSGIGASTKMLLIRRTAEALGTQPKLTEEVMAAIVEQAKQVVANEDAEGQFGIKGTPSHRVLRSRRLEQLVERELLGGHANEVLVRDFAAKATFNGEAYGVLGLLAMSWGKLALGFGGPAGAQYGSFMRTLSNLLNYGLEFGPYGFVRALRGGQGTLSSALAKALPGFKQFAENFQTYEKGSPEYYAALVRAAAGTAVWGALAALVAAAFRDREEGREPFIRIYGEGHQDLRTRRALREAGIFKPQHIRIGFGDSAVWIPYKDLPGVSLALTFAGAISDKVLYGDYEPNEAAAIWGGGFLSGAALLLDREMMSGLFNMLETVSAYSKGETEEGGRLLLNQYRSAVGPFLNPGMTKMVEELVSKQRYDSTSGPLAATMAALPMGQMLANKPAINVLAEPVELRTEDILFGRFFSTTNFHPILGPLAEAGLVVPPPRREVIADDSTRMGVRPAKPEETRRYNELYGETMREFLDPDQVRYLTELAKDGPMQREIAKEILGKFGTAAAQIAWSQMEDEMGVSRGNKSRAIKTRDRWHWEKAALED